MHHRIREKESRDGEPCPTLYPPRCEDDRCPSAQSPFGTCVRYDYGSEVDGVALSVYDANGPEGVIVESSTCGLSVVIADGPEESVEGVEVG